MSINILQKGRLTVITYKRANGLYEVVLSDHKRKKTVKRLGLTEESALQSEKAAIKI